MWGAAAPPEVSQRTGIARPRRGRQEQASNGRHRAPCVKAKCFCRWAAVWSTEQAPSGGRRLRVAARRRLPSPTYIPATNDVAGVYRSGFTCPGSCACRARACDTRCTPQRCAGRRTSACRALPRRTKNTCESRSRSSLPPPYGPWLAAPHGEFNAANPLVLWRVVRLPRLGSPGQPTLARRLGRSLRRRPPPSRWGPATPGCPAQGGYPRSSSSPG